MKKFFIFLFVLIIIFLIGSNKLLAQLYEEERFKVSGYMNFGYVQFTCEEENNMSEVMVGFNSNGSFVQADLNLYFNFFIDEGWRAFSEIGFRYAPSGNYVKDDEESEIHATSEHLTHQEYVYVPENNVAITPTMNRYRYGSIDIERAFIEWNTFSYANIRFGRFFTPYGIWQRDHGAPVYTTTRLPTLIIPSLAGVSMPKQQTGIELLGTIPVGDALMEYAAYVGNGISNNSPIQDDDTNKAVGAFVNFKLPIFGSIDIELGASGYYGQRTILKRRIYQVNYAGLGVDPTDPANLADAATDPYWQNNNTVLTMDWIPEKNQYTANQFDTIALAHLKISIENLPLGGMLIIQVEGMYQMADKNEEDHRNVNSLTGLSVSEDSYTYTNYYVQVEYRIFGRVSPYFRYENTHSDTKILADTMLRDRSMLYCYGINIKPKPRVAIKFEVLVADFYHEKVPKIYYATPSGYQNINTPNNDCWVLMASISVAL